MGVFCVITRPSRRSHGFAAVLAVAALVAFAPSVTGAATSPVASGDGAVVAQALVELDGSERQWATTSSDIEPGGAPIGSAGPGFAVAAEGRCAGSSGVGIGERVLVQAATSRLIVASLTCTTAS